MRDPAMIILMLLLVTSSVRNESAVTRVPLTRVGDYTYTVNVTLGNPPETFRMLWDTSNYFSWVPSLPFTFDVCHGLNFYNATASEDYRSSSYTTSYEPLPHGLRASKTYFSIDTMSINDFSFEEFYFVEVESIPMAQCLQSQYDGLIGVDDYLIMSKIPIFSLYMKRNLSSEDGGELVIGGTDPDRYYEPIHYVPLKNNGDYMWSVNIDRIEVNGTTLCRDGCRAIISTGQSEVTVPTMYYNRLMELIHINYSPSRSPPRGLPTVTFLSCSNLDAYPTISFKMTDNLTLSLAPEDYLIRTHEVNRFPGDTCYAALFGSPRSSKQSHSVQREKRWILGNILIGKFYTTFDSESYQIGFATLKK